MYKIIKEPLNRRERRVMLKEIRVIEDNLLWIEGAYIEDLFEYVESIDWSHLYLSYYRTWNNQVRWLGDRRMEYVKPNKEYFERIYDINKI